MHPVITVVALGAFGLGIWLTFYRGGGAAAHRAPTYVVQVHVREAVEDGPDRRVSSQEPVTVHHLESARRLAWRLRQEHSSTGDGTYALVTITDEHGNDVPLDN